MARPLPIEYPGAIYHVLTELIGVRRTARLASPWWKPAASARSPGIPPTDPRESAIVRTLAPGNYYTVIVRGKDDTTGIGLVETYSLQ